MNITAESSARFWHRVATDGDCWVWTGYTTQLGYGQVKIAQRCYYAHRVAYTELVGDVPAGLVLDHLCRNPRCVNPDHLEPVPQRLNVLRGESPIAAMARRTVCLRGHSLAVHARVNEKGHRQCRACIRFLRAAAKRDRLVTDVMDRATWGGAS